VIVRRSDIGGSGDAAAELTGGPGAPLELPPGRSLREAVHDYQRALVRDALRRHAGSWAAAARELGLHRSNLHHLARRLGLR
jgi:anaerobic nitric oxide reductase transcription regulator